MKRKIEVGHKYFVRMIGRSIYFLGLTVLIPFFPIMMSPGILQHVKSGSMFVGVVLVVAGFFLISQVSSPRSMLRSLGVFTMLPSFLALFYAIIGPDLVNRWVTSFGPASSLIHVWLEFNMPRALTIAAAYFFLGFALLMSSFFWPKK